MLPCCRLINHCLAPSMALDIVIPLLPFEKFIIAHAVLCVIGFLGLLPLGALVARYTRTFSPNWFKAHWIIQFAIGASSFISSALSPVWMVGDVTYCEQLVPSSSSVFQWASTQSSLRCLDRLTTCTSGGGSRSLCSISHNWRLGPPSISTSRPRGRRDTAGARTRTTSMP